MSSYSFDGLVGHIQRFDSFASKYVIPRRVDIWTPPIYTENSSQRFKVLYMHDGENIFDSSSSKWSHMDWGIDETVTRLMTEGKIQPTIVVGIWSTDIRVAEYMPQKLPQTPAETSLRRMIHKWVSSEICSDNYLRFLVEELKPYRGCALPYAAGPAQHLHHGFQHGRVDLPLCHVRVSPGFWRRWLCLHAFPHWARHCL